MISRVESGIPGLDPLIQGGFLSNSVNLISGETGTGKTIFCLQFLWHGLQKGENCLYITLEEEPNDILEDALQFGWDFNKFIKKGMFKISYYDPAQMSNMGSMIMDEIRRMGVKRLVIDSISIVGLIIENPSQTRKNLYNLISTIKKTECTVLLTSEIVDGSQQLSRSGVEEFVVDGVIRLCFTGVGGEEENRLQVRKMRRTRHPKGFFPFSFTSKGIVVRKDESSVLMK
ncbi:MAG: ATPase domain-containing protein [Candidatus Aenigmatarchaeota archaeon]